MKETRETRVQSLGQENPWRKKWQPIPVYLPREAHGQRSLAGYSPWGLKESDMTELTHTQTHILIHTHTHPTYWEGTSFASLELGGGGLRKLHSSTYPPPLLIARHTPTFSRAWSPSGSFLQTMPDAMNKRGYTKEEMERIFLTSRSPSPGNLKWLGQHDIETPGL